MDTIRFNEETTMDEYRKEADAIMFRLIERCPDGFTAQEFNDAAKSAKFPPSVIRTISGAIFRQFAGVNYIEKTSEYRLSKRNSAPLPVWRKVIDN